MRIWLAVNLTMLIAGIAFVVLGNSEEKLGGMKPIGLVIADLSIKSFAVLAVVWAWQWALS